MDGCTDKWVKKRKDRRKKKGKTKGVMGKEEREEVNFYPREKLLLNHLAPAVLI